MTGNSTATLAAPACALACALIAACGTHATEEPRAIPLSTRGMTPLAAELVDHLRPPSPLAAAERAALPGLDRVHDRARRPTPIGRPWPEPTTEEAPTFSPDGSALAFAITRAGLSEVWSADVATGARHRLSASGSLADQPTWSPDGRHLAYVTQTAAGRRIHLVRANGSGDIALETAASAWLPRWIATPPGRAMGPRAPLRSRR